jgi:hypothetical protein
MTRCKRMLLISAVLAFVSAAILLFWFSKRHTYKLSESNTRPLESPPARSLFAPSEDDLRREHQQTEAREIAKREYLAKTQARAIVDGSLTKWRENPNGKNAAELLRAAAEKGIEGDFARAADEIVASFRESGIDGLTAGDLAALLDSHTKLLSQTERSSGEIFWLRQEVARLSSEK